jgi:hypothetical protein
MQANKTELCLSSLAETEANLAAYLSLSLILAVLAAVIVYVYCRKNCPSQNNIRSPANTTVLLPSSVRRELEVLCGHENQPAQY